MRNSFFLTFQHPSPAFPEHEVFWSSLSRINCDDVSCALQLRPADQDILYMY